MAYIIVNRNKRNADGRIWKTKSGAESHIKGVIKNNSLKQRKMTGFIGLRTKKRKLNEREKKELKGNKKFIWN